MRSLFILCTLCLSLQVHSKPYCVAHRALGYGHLENSLAALTAASRSDAVAIEFDLNHTKDGTTLVYHDKTLERDVIGVNCPKGEKIQDLNSKTIRALCKLKNGEFIPTLEEALEILSEGHSKLFIEFKDNVREADLKIIKKYFKTRPEKIHIISFKKEYLKPVAIKKKSDSFYAKTKIILLKKNGHWGSLKGLDGIDAKYINKIRVKKLIKRGKLVGVYTKNSRKKIEKYLNKGVHFITTDKSKKCEGIIDKMFSR